MLIGPILPVWLNETILNVLVENFNLGLITTPKEALKKNHGLIKSKIFF